MLIDRHRRWDGEAGGTRFRIFPQMPGLEGFAEPETVLVSPRPGTIAPGPFDGAMQVIDPIHKTEPYAFPDMPPFQGAIYPPAMPGPDGHFDHIAQDSRQFVSAHMYGSIRFVLDIWEDYFGKTVDWYDPRDGFIVELVPDVDWDNAHAGVGFIETGGRVNAAGHYHPFALNFDVLAHEVGHTLLFSELGIPTGEGLTGQFLGFHESMSDMVALLSTLHFDSITDDLIDQTGGNLYVLNFLNRIGELSNSEQIRIASNSAVMADLAGLRLGPDGEWIDPTGQGRKAHQLAQPLTGALFDTLTEIYQDGLARRGVIGGGLDPRGWDREKIAASLSAFHDDSSGALALHRPAFLDALKEARDLVGFALARSWLRLGPNNLTFGDFVETYLEEMVALGQGHNLEAFTRDFLARGIDVRRTATIDPDPPPPASAPYLVRWQWMQRRRHGDHPHRSAAAEGAGSYERIYKMFDHSFRVGV